MIHVRKSKERGNSKLGWLDSYHTFSFSDYYDDAWMGFGNLRVINEDTVQAGYGFGKHPHSDMEIISYVIAGSLEHKDSMGTGSIIKPGDIQRMSAGTGVEHSEYNPSTTEAVHFLQIWIIPEKRGLQSAYEQKAISQSHNQFILIGSRTGENGAITIHQDVELYAAYLTRDAVIQHTFQNKRRGWLQLIHGKINLNGQVLSAGDGAAIIDDMTVSVTCLEDAELLLFDLV